MKRLFSGITAISVGRLQSVFSRVRVLFLRRLLGLSDVVHTRKFAFAVAVVAFGVGLAPPKLGFAQEQSAPVENANMTPVRFLQLLRDLAGLGTLERIDDVARILGAELVQSSPGFWFDKKGAEKPTWLWSASLNISPPAPDRSTRAYVNIQFEIEVVCIRFADVLAAFPGDYFEYMGPPSIPQAIPPEVRERFSTKRRELYRERGLGPVRMFVPIYQPTEGRIDFDFSFFHPCLHSARVTIPYSSTPPALPFPIFRRVSRQ